MDTNYITFIDDSVEINNVAAQSSEFSYEESSHTLIINLAKVAAQSKTIVTFNVKKTK